jgi:hypothetical protein
MGDFCKKQTLRSIFSQIKIIKMDIIIDYASKPTIVTEGFIAKENKKKQPFADKIARGTALLNQTGLPLIEPSEQAITYRELSEILKLLAFSESSEENYLFYRLENHDFTVKIRQNVLDNWLTEAMTNKYARQLTEHSLIDSTIVLFDLAQQIREDNAATT